MSVSGGAVGDLARVRHVDSDHDMALVEFPNGRWMQISGAGVLDWDEGTVLLLSGTEDTLDAKEVPVEIWPEERWVGVVRFHADNDMIVDTSGRLRLVPTSSVPCKVGNTVEGRDSIGVMRVLSEEPVRYLDLPEVDETIVKRFRPDQTKTSFDDFGGLDHVKDQARELVETPLKYHAELAKIGARPIKGVLFTGLPGTGKTMLARIIASESGAAFYEISGPEIFSKWYGETQKILRLIFDDAMKQPSSIIFFDEIDSVAGQRSNDTHEESKRVVGQLLTLMDGFEPTTNVVVIAATNRPQDIDAALLRPGRFDREIMFPPPDLHDREAILSASARAHNVREPLPHDTVAASTESWSAAQLVTIWSEAARLAVTDNRAVIMAEDYLGGYQRVSERRRSGSAVDSSVGA